MDKAIIKYVRISNTMDKEIKETMKKKYFESFTQFARYAFKKVIEEEKDDK